MSTTNSIRTMALVLCLTSSVSGCVVRSAVGIATDVVVGTIDIATDVVGTAVDVVVPGKKR